MIDKSYSKAYTEVLEIISHFPKEEYSKIPEERIEYFRQNMDNEYIFKIDPEIDLDKQNISKEANAIIISLYKEYYATEEEKEKIDKILKLNQEKAENEKRNKYNPDDLFKNKKGIKTSNVDNVDTNNTNALIEIPSENFLTRFVNYIKKILGIQKNKNN